MIDVMKEYPEAYTRVLGRNNNLLRLAHERVTLSASRQ